MYCKQCGREQQAGEMFCSNCGTPYSVQKEEKEDVLPESENHEPEEKASSDSSPEKPTTPDSSGGGTSCLTWIIVIAIGLFMFVKCGCSSGSVFSSNEEKAAAYAEEQLIRSLRDPSSYENIETTSNRDNAYSREVYCVCITYRARNGFGGMTSDTRCFRIGIAENNGKCYNLSY